MASVSTPLTFDVKSIRKDFPILKRKVNDKPLVYFDNAATSQTPQQVIDVIVDYYSNYNANIHRGVHALSQEATDAYEQARIKLQKHFNIPNAYQTLFTSGTTHGINIVASGYAKILEQGDEVIVSALEHHSNIVPWQLACRHTGAKLRIIPVTQEGEFDLDEFQNMLSEQTRLVSVAHMTNVTGTIYPVQTIIEKAHAVGAQVVLDGAQAIAHLSVDVQALDVDYYVFSGHKLYGPTGIGILYGKYELLEALSPYQGGSDMIETVSFAGSTFQAPPLKFEAGTPSIASVLGLGAAIDYLNTFDREAALQWEIELKQRALEGLSDAQILGNGHLLSFVLDDCHPLDVGTFLNLKGIAVRTGHLCSQPTMDHFRVQHAIRLSFGPYNTFEEVDAFLETLSAIKKDLQ